jgi:signal transduction histidine kinase/ActR/RegA family two-component response regulator
LGKENYQHVIEDYLSHSVDVKQNFDLSILTKNGEVRDLHFSMFKAVLHSGMIGTGLTASDVTERNHLLKEMAEAKERAEYYSQLKSDFLSRMSHEMRTPMNAVLNMASLAKSAADEPRRTTCLENIEESADQMLQIVNDILDMTKIDAGSFALFAKAFDLSEFLRSLCDCARRRAAAKGLTFEAKFDSALPDMLIADEGRLRQALDNLLSNAFKFTPKGGEVRFHVRKLSEHGDNCELQFQIQDNGVGISAEKRCHLWDAFEQADNSTTRAYGGIGLGLPITRKIVELMGGNIQLDSELGKGTTFSVLIRFEFSYKQLRNETDMSPTAMSGKRILIVDDIEMNREILMALLEDCGAILEQAADGLEAVQMFSRVSYDVVLMDLHMPGMNGFNAVRQMRQSAVPQASSCRIIAVTADTGGDMIQKCLECGMNDHLAKPVNYDSLIAIIELHLRHKDVLL